MGNLAGHGASPPGGPGFGEQSSPARLIVYCGDYKCAHSGVVDASRWDDDVRLSHLELKFTCLACGHRGADIRPRFAHARMGAG